METSREGFRWMIFYDFKCGLTQKQCIEHLQQAFGDEVPSKTTIFSWFAEFNRCRASVSNEFREGRPKSVVVPENIDDVREMILEDRHVTYHEIESSLGISATRVHSILHEHLAVKKLCLRWIPHNSYFHPNFTQLNNEIFSHQGIDFLSGVLRQSFSLKCKLKLVQGCIVKSPPSFPTRSIKCHRSKKFDTFLALNY